MEQGQEPEGQKDQNQKINQVPADIVQDVKSAGMKPLDYMLMVMNDRIAVAAAPYVHKKEERQEAAKKVSTGRFKPLPCPSIITFERDKKQ